MGMSEQLQDFITNIVKKLVDSPDAVDIKVSVSTKNIIAQIKVAKTDYGKVIGKKGRTIESLKVITSAIKNTSFPDDNRKVSLEILEDENSRFNAKKNYQEE